MTGLAEWFQENSIPVKLLDLDTENKSRGSLTHFFGGQVPKVNIHTPAGLDAFVDELTDGPPVILADMGAGAGQVTYDWFDKMYPSVAEAGIAFNSVGVITADPASVESILAWASRLRDRTAYLIVENSITEHTDFRYWRETHQALLFQQTYSPAVAGSKGKTLVVCATHDEIDRVTEAIRDRKRASGQLGEGVALTRHVSLNWTKAQKADLQNYRPGQMLAFHRPVRGISKNEAVEVVGVAESGIAIRSSGGRRSKVSKRHAGSFDVLEAKPIEVSAGDRLLLTANRRDAGLRVTNGELVTVSGIDSLGRIQLEDGRRLPVDYRSFTHGYAVTAHRSQGKTVDLVILSGDGMQKELFYVAASRGRHSVTVITSDKERLQQTVGRSMARTSATELLRDRSKCIRRGAPRGIEMAREMVRRAAALLTAASKQVVQQEVSRFRERKERRRERGLGR